MTTEEWQNAFIRWQSADYPPWNVSLFLYMKTWNKALSCVLALLFFFDDVVVCLFF
jgi:hypothetical protein